MGTDVEIGKLDGQQKISGVKVVSFTCDDLTKCKGRA